MPDKLYVRTRTSRRICRWTGCIEGSSIDQLYDEIWEVYREYAQQCSLFFIIKLDSNHANHICIIMNYNNQYKHITVILNSLNLSLIH